MLVKLRMTGDSGRELTQSNLACDFFDISCFYGFFQMNPPNWNSVSDYQPRAILDPEQRIAKFLDARVTAGNHLPNQLFRSVSTKAP